MKPYINSVILKGMADDSTEKQVTFIQYTASNGNSVYVAGSDIVDKEAGNNAYLSLSGQLKDKAKSVRITEMEDDGAIIDYIMSAWDLYAEEIGDDDKREKAIAANRHLVDLADAFRKAAGI